MKKNKTNQIHFDLPSPLQLLEFHLQEWKHKQPSFFQANSTIDSLTPALKALDEINSAGQGLWSSRAVRPMATQELPSIKSAIPKKSHLNFNEFFCLIDLYNPANFVMDAQVDKVLGLHRSKFTLRSMAGFDPINPIPYREDVKHIVRWTSIAYIVLTYDFFVWTPRQDIFKLQFRASTAHSKDKELREAKYVCLENTCFIADPNMDTKLSHPKQLLNKISVLPEHCFHQVKLQLIQKPLRESAINGFIYLLNVTLLGISLKHLLILYERSKHHAITATTVAINHNIFLRHNISNSYNDKQIADCLQKTIRKKISHLTQQWCNRSKNRRIFCETDAEVIQCANHLGLLPIPPGIYQLIYRHSFIFESHDA